MSYDMLTRHYYAKWADVEPAIFDTEGISVVESAERETIQKGYSRPFDLYCLLTQKATVISHSRSLRNEVGEICRLCNELESISELVPALRSKFNREVGHSIKFVFTKTMDLDTSGAVRLNPENYDDYLEFFVAVHPNANTDWVEEYYLSMVEDKNCWGVYDGTRLASCTDAPDIPYMSDIIVEPGINTRPEYRQKGYAKRAVGAMITSLVENGKVPIWSCAAENEASNRLAQSVGYRKFADLITLSLS